MKGLIGILILSAACLDGCRSGSSGSVAGPCADSSTCRLTSVAYGAGVFVAVGAKFTGEEKGGPWIEVSTDGIDWTPEDIQYTSAQLNQAFQLQSITYGKDGFVTTDGAHVLHSADGLNWSIESFQDTSDKISYVIYDSTRYILYSNTTGQFGSPGDGSAFIIDNFPWKVSTDGVDWSDYGTITVTNGPAGEPVSIIHVAGMYEAAWQAAESVTSPTRYLTATSPDGLSWTLGTPVAVTASGETTFMYDILHTGDQYFLFGGMDETDEGTGSWGVALHGTSLSAMTAVGPLTADKGGIYPEGEFYPAGEPLHGDSYESDGLVSNGTVTVGLGEGGLFVTTDGATWKYESLEGVVPETGCTSTYPGAPTCTAFAAGAAAPGGSIVVLTARGSSGAETTDGVHWVTSNL